MIHLFNLTSVQDIEMGFEKIVKIAHSRGACKQQDVMSKLRTEVSWCRSYST